MLDRANVQHELFRLASLGLEEACGKLGIEVPVWMQRLLELGDGDRWEDTSYRTSKKFLLRYGMIRPIAEPWKGMTMHGLVQWRASVGLDRGEYCRLHLAFMVAVCSKVENGADSVRFRRHVVTHLPSNQDLLVRTGGMEDEGMWWMWSWVGRVLWEEGRWKEAEELEVKVMEARL